MAITNLTISAPQYISSPKIAAAVGSALAQTFWGPAAVAGTVTAVNFIQGTQGSSTAGINLFKDTATQAPGAGTSMLVGGVALVSSAITNNTLTVCSMNAAGITVAVGDRFSYLLTGTLTALENAVFGITFNPTSV